jgi:hypothetical protein
MRPGDSGSSGANRKPDKGRSANSNDYAAQEYFKNNPTDPSIPLTDRPSHKTIGANDNKLDTHPSFDAINSDIRGSEIGQAIGQAAREAEEDVFEQSGLAAEKKMSRTPFLLRSSPALGTGSYGAVPSFSGRELSSKSDSEEEDLAEGDAIQDSVTRWRKKIQKAKRSTRSAFADEGTSSSRSSRLASSQLLNEDHDQDGLFFSNTGHASDNAPDSESDVYPEGKILRGVGDDLSPTNENSFNIHGLPKVKDDSIYPEVRAAVSPYDNTELSVNTPRMWFLSLFFAFFGSAMNLFFSLRYPSISITPVIALLFAHPLGLLWDRMLKRRSDPEFRFAQGTRVGDLDDDCSSIGGDSTSVLSDLASAHTGRRTSIKTDKPSLVKAWRIWLSQGKWNQKEHACVYIASNVSFGFAFATDVCIYSLHNSCQTNHSSTGHC